MQTCTGNILYYLRVNIMVVFILSLKCVQFIAPRMRNKLFVLNKQL